MADATATAVLRTPGVSSEGRFFVAEYNVNVVAGDYVTGGLPLSFVTPGISALGTPTVAFSSPMVTGYYLEYSPGTTMANGTLKVYDDAMAQHAAAPLAGAVAGGSFRATLRIPKFKR